MNNLFAQSRSHWVRYDRYEIKTGKDGKRYITPEKTAKPDIYNPLKESSEMVLEALNVGMLMMNRAPADEVEKAILAFVTHYGLLGLMTTLPTTPSLAEVVGEGLEKVQEKNNVGQKLHKTPPFTDGWMFVCNSLPIIIRAVIHS